MRRVIGFLFLAALIAAVPAQAQDKKIDVNIGAGYTFSLSEVRKHLGDGYNIDIGLTFNVTPVIGIQAEYAYNGLGNKRIDPMAVNIPGGAVQEPIYGHMNMQYGDFNLVLKPPVSGKARPYIVAGIGIYYRPVKITTPTAGYVPPYCDPWWYYCWPGGFVEVDQVIASKSSTDFGINFGAGLNFMIAETASIYVEARYHYMWGPELVDSTGKSYGKANGQFLPIVFGIRF